MIQYLAKFISNLSDISAPLRKLREGDTEWRQEEAQKMTFEGLKQLLTNPHYQRGKPGTLYCRGFKSNLPQRAERRSSGEWIEGELDYTSPAHFRGKTAQFEESNRWESERSAVPRKIQPHWTFRDEITSHIWADVQSSKAHCSTSAETRNA